MMATLQMSDSSEDLDVNEKSAFMFCITRLILFLQIFRICYWDLLLKGFKLDSRMPFSRDAGHAARGAITDSPGVHSRTAADEGSSPSGSTTAGATDVYRSPTG